MPGLGQGWGDVVMSGLWGDAGQEAKDFSEEQNRKNRAAFGMDANGNLLPQAQPGAQPGVGSGQIAPPAGPPPGTLPTGQEPNATKTPQSWGSIIMDLTRQEEAAAGFNQALGMAGAAISRPENRERATNMFKYPYVDPMKLGETLQNSASQQQGQDRASAIGQTAMDPNRALAMANSLNMPGRTDAEKIANLQAAVRADPQSVMRMIETTQKPTPDVANLDQITRLSQLQDQYMKASQAKAPPDQLHSIRNQLIAKAAGTEAAPMIADQMDYFDKHGALPLWHDNLSAYKQYKDDQASLSTEVQDAAARHSSYIKQASQFSGLIDEIKSDPNLDTLLSTPGEAGKLKRAAAQAVISTDLGTPMSLALNALPPDLAGVTFTAGEQKLLAKMREAGGKQYGAALKSIGLSKPTGAEASAIDQGLSEAKNVSQLDANAYREQALNPLGDLVDTQIGTSYGISHNLKNMPARYRTYVPPEYLEGGTRHLENYPSDGSAEWGKSLTMDESDQAAANNALAQRKINPDTITKDNPDGRPFTRYELDQYLRKRGKRPNY